MCRLWRRMSRRPFLRDEQINGTSWHFNFFNNAWNTNYPLWQINTDERFRFVLSLR